MDPLITPVHKSVVFETPWLRLEALEMAPRGGIGAHATYHRVVEDAGVICVVLSADGDFVMVRQPRPVVESYTLEFPAGGMEAGELPEDTARREVLEETGLDLAYLQYLGVTEPIPSRLHTPQSLFIGVTAPGTPLATREHGAELVLVPRDQFLSVMKRDGMHCLAALGALKLAELTWSIDLFKAPIDVICRHFSKEMRS